MSRAAEKLRAQDSLAGLLHVYIRTNPHKPDNPQYANGMTISLPSPTDDTLQLVKTALWVLKRLYKPHYAYAKTGVYLSDLIPRTSAQTDLFTQAQPTSRSQNLMSTIDQINSKMGRATIKLGSEGMSYSWKMRSSRKSLNYTTSWNGLLSIN
ncbi:MAG: DUF4113 domain-containing protein [Methylophilaceae bacterium]|nr:DUF4113 domain-containing protein [Methylophilaceae bacterium]